jgi:hypothetical protein
VITPHDVLVRHYQELSIQADFGVSYEDMRAMLCDMGVLGRPLTVHGPVQVAEFSYSSLPGPKLLPSGGYCLHPIFSTFFEIPNSDEMLIHPEGASLVL